MKELEHLDLHQNIEKDKKNRFNILKKVGNENEADRLRKEAFADEQADFNKKMELLNQLRREKKLDLNNFDHLSDKGKEETLLSQIKVEKELNLSQQREAILEGVGDIIVKSGMKSLFDYLHQNDRLLAKIQDNKEKPEEKKIHIQLIPYQDLRDRFAKGLFDHQFKETYDKEKFLKQLEDNFSNKFIKLLYVYQNVYSKQTAANELKIELSQEILSNIHREFNKFHENISNYITTKEDSKYIELAIKSLISIKRQYRKAIRQANQ